MNERRPKMDMQMANGLSQHWVTVTDEAGREHLEARWLGSDIPALTVYAA